MTKFLSVILLICLGTVQGNVWQQLMQCKAKVRSLEDQLYAMENGAYYVGGDYGPPPQQQPKQTARTCADFRGSGNGHYFIQPDLNSRAQKVYCKFVGNTAYTVIHHNSEKEMRARDCERPLCSVRKVQYNKSMAFIRALIFRSTKCRQYIKYRCQGSLMNSGSTKYWAWSGFHGKNHFNWGGASRAGYCACGEKGNCRNRRQKCNCDQNSSRVNTYDAGYLTNKAYLPVTAMKFGDLGARSERGWHTLGPLECS